MSDDVVGSGTVTTTASKRSEWSVKPLHGPRPTVGLRERKKAKTRAAIREHAMRLFMAQGYADTTVDQIADAAEVSPSTFFRYFPTKEDVVLGDDYDALMVEAFRAQPAGLTPMQAIRSAMRATFADMSDDARARERARMRLVKAVPELRAAAMDDYTRSMRMLAELLAERMGRDPDEFPVQVFAGAVVGVALAAMQSNLEESTDDLTVVLDRGFELLESGLPL
jgi:AcrR family transcriptional regulator